MSFTSDGRPDLVRRLKQNAYAKVSGGDVESADEWIAAVEIERLQEAAALALGLIDKALGDTDPQDENNPLLRACQTLSNVVLGQGQPDTEDEDGGGF
jgi:hypothetical protein